MDKDRMNRSKKGRKKNDILKRVVVVLLAVSMVSAWPLSSNMVFAEQTPDQAQTPAQQSEEQVVLNEDQQGAGQDNDQGADQGTVQEPAADDSSSAGDGNAVKKEDQSDNGNGSSDQKKEDQASADKSKDSADKSKDDSSKDKDKEDPAEKYKDLMTLAQLAGVPDTDAKATIQYVGKNTGRVTKARGWAVNDYYVNQDDSHFVKMTKDFSLKHQIEFTTTKDIEKGKIEIRVPLSLVSYEEKDEEKGEDAVKKVQVTPSAIGIPEGSKGNGVEKKDTFFNYYVSRGTGPDGEDELVFFNYTKVPEGTASGWQVLYRDVDVSKVVKDSAWSFIPSAEVKTDKKTEKLEDGELAPLKGVVEYRSEEAEGEDEAADEGSDQGKSDEDKKDEEMTKEDPEAESAEADADAPGSLDELKDLDADKASAVQTLDKKAAKKALGTPAEGRPWSFDLYYVKQNNPSSVWKTDDFTLKYQMEFHTSQSIDAFNAVIKVPASTVKYGHRDEPRKEIYPSDFGIPQGSYDPATGKYTFTEAKRSAFNYYISEGTGKDGEDEIVFFNYREIPAGENNAWQVLYKGDTANEESAFNVMNIEDGFEWTVDPDVRVKVLKAAEGDDGGEPVLEEQTLEENEVTPLTGHVDTYTDLRQARKRVYSSGASYTPGLYTEKQLLRYAPDAASKTIPGTSDKVLDKFDDYKFVVWQIDYNGYATQPYDIKIMEQTGLYDIVAGQNSEGFVVGAYSADLSNSRSSGDCLKIGKTIEGNDEYGEPDTIVFDAVNYSKSRTINRSYFVVTAYPADKVKANTTILYNSAQVDMIPYDMPYDEESGYGWKGATGNDSYQSRYVGDNWAWADYDWKYSGDIIGIEKKLSDPSRESELYSWTTVHRMSDDIDQKTANFNVRGTCRSFAFTHKLEKVNGQPYQNEVTYNGAKVGDYIPGTYVKVTTTDDFVYAYPNDGAKAGQKYKLTQDDYYFNKVTVSISDSGYDIYEDEPGNTVPVSETQGIDRDLHIYAMFAGSEEWEKVDTVKWNSSGQLSYTFTSEQIARQPWRVKIEHNAVDFVTYSNINTNITIKADSPAFEEFADADTVQLENLSGIAGERFHNNESYGYFQDQTESKYNGYEDQGLLPDTQALYGTVLQRDNAMTKLLGEKMHAVARKQGKAYNDQANSRAVVRYKMEASEGYQVYSEDAVNYLKQSEDLPKPMRKEVVFYDLLPYGVTFDPSGKITAGRVTEPAGGEISENSWDKSQVSVTVDTKNDIIKNYNGTGRTLVRFHVTYTGRDSSFYKGGQWFTGFGVAFDAYCSYENYEEATERPNIVAYMPGNDDDQEIIGTDSEVSLDDGNARSSDGFARYYREMGPDINGDGVTTSKNVLYAQSQVFSDIAIAAGNKVEKFVRADDDPFGEYKDSTAVTPNKGYEYKILVSNPTKYALHDMVLFDRIENSINDRQTEEPGKFDDTDWKGTFDEVNLAEMKAAMKNKGVNFEPVLYYNASRDAKIPARGSDTESRAQILSSILTPENGWIKASDWTGSKSDVKAVAVDLGSDFALDSEESVTMYIHMNSPEEIPEDAKWAYNYAGFYSYQEEVDAKSTEYCNSTKVKIVDARQFVLEKKFSDDTPADKRNESFKFYVKWDDGNELKDFSYKEYTLYQKDSEGDWVPQAGIHATGADGSLTLKEGQRAMFNDIDADNIVVKEKDSIRWSVELQDEKEDGVRTVTAVNTYRPLLYVTKNVQGYPSSDAADINLQSFRMKLTDADGQPVKNADLFVVNRAVTNGGEPVIIDGAHKLYGNLVTVSESDRPEGTRTLKTDENGEFVIYPQETIAIPMDKAGGTYKVTELEECYSSDTDWICEKPEASGKLAVGGTELSISNFYRWKQIKISKTLKNVGDNDVSGMEFSFKIYKANSEDPSDKGEQVKNFKWQLLDSADAAPDEDAWLEPAEDGTITAECAGKVIVVDRFQAGTEYIVEEVMDDEVAKLFDAEEESIYVLIPTYANAGKADFVNTWKLCDLEIDKGIISAYGGGYEPGGYMPYPAIIETAPAGTDNWTYLKGAEYEYVDDQGNTVYFYGEKHTYTDSNGKEQVRWDMLPPTTEKDDTKELIPWVYGMKTGTGAPFSSDFMFNPTEEGPAGLFMLMANYKVRFKNLDTKGTKWRVRELLTNPYDMPVVPGLDESTYEVFHDDQGNTTGMLAYSKYVSGELGEQPGQPSTGKFVNGQDGYIIIKKDWVADDAKSQKYMEQEGGYFYSYYKIESDVPLRVINSYNADYYASGYYVYDNGYSGYVPCVRMTGDDAYIVLGVEDTGRYTDLDLADIKVTEMSYGGQYYGSDVKPFSTRIFSPQYGEFSGDIFSVSLNGEAEREVTPSEDPVVTFENHISTNGSAVQKRVFGSNVPKGKTLTWRVEKYENGKWVPAEGVGYTLDSYTFSSNYRYEGEQPVKGFKDKTGSDGLIKFVTDKPFHAQGDQYFDDYDNYTQSESVAYVLFDRKVYVNHFGGIVKEGDYRVVEVPEETDEEWGVFATYTTTPIVNSTYYYNYGTTPPSHYFETSATVGSNMATGFVNSTKMAKIKIEKVVDEPTDKMFTFKMEQYVHITSNDELAPGAQLNYIVYDKETDEPIREGTTTAKGELELQGGQYAVVEVPPNSRWKITELTSMPYYIEKIELSNGEVIEGDNNGEVSLAGDGKELVKSQIIRPDLYNAVRQLQHDTGLGSDQSSIKHIILGKTSDYSSVVSDDCVIIDTKGLGTIKGYLKDNGDGTQDFYILSDDLMYTPPNSQGLFAGFYGVESISFDNTSTSKTVDMSGFFASCNSLKEIEGIDAFDTSNVVNMGYMFGSCTSIENIDLSSFDTSNVVDMNGMFQSCNSLTSLDISGFDTGNVVNMGGMFSGCSSITNIDVSSFDTSKTQYMSNMFSDCTKLENINGVKDLVSSSVQNAQRMFSNTPALKELDLSGWDVSGIETGYYNNGLQYFLSGCGVEELDLSGWDVSNFNSFNYLFAGANSLKKIDLSGWNASNATRTEYMFDGCSSLQEVDMSDWRSNNIYSTQYMFRNCSSLKSVDLSGWDTSALYSMNYMFYGCESLEEIDLSDWDETYSTSHYANYMFYNCTSLKKAKLGAGVGYSLYNAESMFYNCSSLEEIDLSTWTSLNLYNANSMFAYCSSLKELDLSASSYIRPRYASSMFAYCSSLETLNIKGLRPYSYSNWGSNMFTNDSKLSTIYCNYNWPNNYSYSYPTMFYGCTSLPGWASNKTTMRYAYPGTDGYFTTAN